MSLYLRTVGTVIYDDQGNPFRMQGAQWQRGNLYTEANPNPNLTPPHGDAWQAKNVHGLNMLRVGIGWHAVELNPPTLVSPGVYAHDWTDSSGVIDSTWDTPDGYLAALDLALADIKDQGLRVILELHQSQWSPATDPAGYGMPNWLYATPSGPLPATLSVATSVVVPTSQVTSFNVDATLALTPANWPSSGQIRVSNPSSGTVFVLNYSAAPSNAAPGGHARFVAKRDSSSPTGTIQVGASIVLIPDETGAAKWEFFQPNGGWKRPGIVGPPQDLFADFWKFMSQRFAYTDVVVAADIMNEPGWPQTHPVPTSASATANPSAPTGTELVGFYNRVIPLIRASANRWLIVYENGTYANSVAGRVPISAASGTINGSNLVYSWHYYPTNPQNGNGPGGTPPGTAPTSLTPITNAQGYLEAHRALAQDTFGHPFWVGETSIYEHVQNNIANREWDYADTIYDPTNARFDPSMLLWERLWRDFLSWCRTHEVSWAVWAYQPGAGRSMLTTTTEIGKTDFVPAIAAYAGSIAPSEHFTVPPALAIVRRGTVNFFECDINGGAAEAIWVSADNGNAVVSITNNDLGSDLLDSDDLRVASTPPNPVIVQISKKKQVSANRVTATITGNRISPYADAGGGSSLLLGTTDTYVSTSDNVYQGASGTPATAFFEDYASIVGLGGVAPRITRLTGRDASGTIIVKPSTLIKITAGVSPRMQRLTGRNRSGTITVKQQQFIDFSDNGISPVLTCGVPTVRVGGVRIVGLGGVAPRITRLTGRDASGTPTIKLELYPINPVAVPQRAIFGRPSLQLMGEINMTAVPQRAVFGVPTVQPGVVRVLPVSVPQRKRFGVLTVTSDVRPVSVPQRAVYGTLVVRAGAVRVRPQSVPQRAIFGQHQVVLGNPRVTLVAMRQRAVFGQTKLLSELGEAEAFGHVVGF